MKTLILSAICGLAVLTSSAVSTAEAGHPAAYRIRAAKHFRARTQVSRAARQGTTTWASPAALGDIKGDHPVANSARRVRTARFRTNLFAWLSMDGINGE